MSNTYPFVGNAESGIVHRKGVRSSGCRVTEILPENRENFKTLAQALNLRRGKRKAYRACKRCASK